MKDSPKSIENHLLSYDKYSKKLMLTIMILCLAIPAGADEVFFESETMACTFSYPEGWFPDTTLAHRVTLINETNGNITISIGRYGIESSNHIKSGAELYEAISGLYEDLGINIEKDREITYSLHGGRADFEIEYRQYEPPEDTYYQKYLRGSVVRTVSDDQLFYLIIAQAPEEKYSSVQPAFKTIINSFVINENLAERLYVGRDFLPYLLILLIMALTVFFFARNRRIQKSRHPLGKDSSSFWRCPKCGLANHIELMYCNRCGEERQEVGSIHRQ